MSGNPILQVDNLVKHYPIKSTRLFGRQARVKAVDGVSFDIEQSKTLGIVGESGSGKSTLGKMILKLIPATSGNVWFKKRNVFTIRPRELRLIRKDLQFIFQDPYSSLNPRMKIKKLLLEPLELQSVGTKKSREETVVEMIEKVGLSTKAFSKYPHEFSGGQRQRISIARALVLNPSFVLCDEPVSALDVSIQSQIINLLMDLQKEMGLTSMFISHDLSVVRHISDRVAVLYLGKVVEMGDTEEIFSQPAHPYTKALLSANLEPNPGAIKNRIILKGEIPSALELPTGCRFHTRCQERRDVCQFEEPHLAHLGNRHYVACQFCNHPTIKA